MRNKILNLKVSEAELADVKARAGGNVSDYLRSLIFTDETQPTLGDENFAAARTVQSADAQVIDRLAPTRETEAAYRARMEAVGLAPHRIDLLADQKRENGEFDA